MASKPEIVRGVMQAWGRILSGRRPNLSVEITRECPLRCPGCYAFGDHHLGSDVTLRGCGREGEFFDESRREGPITRFRCPRTRSS
jgi:hypothetical protein